MSKKFRYGLKTEDFHQQRFAGKFRVNRQNRDENDLATESVGVGDSESRHCSVASTRNFSAAGMLSNNMGQSHMEANSHVDDSQSSHVCGKRRSRGSSHVCGKSRSRGSSHVCGKRRSRGFFSEEEVAAEVHEVELYAYFSVLRVLYAYGPLSWEQEALLTNLRLSLNISNEEHLFQLRRLFSAEAL